MSKNNLGWVGTYLLRLTRCGGAFGRALVLAVAVNVAAVGAAAEVPSAAGRSSACSERREARSLLAEAGLDGPPPERPRYDARAVVERLCQSYNVSLPPVGLYPMLDASIQGDVAAVEKRLSEGSSPLRSLGGAITIFDLTAAAGQVAVLDVFWKRVRIEEEKKKILERGDVLLCIAASVGAAPVVAWLLGHGVNYNAQTPLGATALMHAAMNGQQGVVRQLLAGGADPDLVCTHPEAGYDSMSAYDFAVMKGHSEAAEVLKEVTTVARGRWG